MKDKIAVALSGGIDSTVSAWLLKKKGYNLIGLHFLSGYEGCSHEQRLMTAHERTSKLSDLLEFPVKLINCSHIFQKEVIEYFLKTYHIGKTPNPCMVCNAKIKFGFLLSYAKKIGASCLATGHYARIIKRKERFGLLQGIDLKKDQSYFLARLNQDQLKRACFPLGEMTKEKVRVLAAENRLPPLYKKESQDICFIRHGHYSDFLNLQEGFKPKPGIIVDPSGKMIGEHRGLHSYTVGQRRGINCPGPEPYYVLKLDVIENRLIVGHKKDLLTSWCYTTDINWIQDKGHSKSPFPIEIRVRYRQKATGATLFPIDSKRARINFHKPQYAVTPGQGAVFYHGQEVLGSGWITDEGI